jgi:hypothetical protein
VIFLPLLQSGKRQPQVAQCRALVMGKAERRGRAAAQNCNTPIQLAADPGAPRDRLNHPRYRDFAMIPEAEFFQ